MNKYASLSLFILMTLTVINAKADSAGFRFNNKNLNALTALICHSTSELSSPDRILIHKLQVDKSKLGTNANEVSYELSGTCHVEYDLKTKEVLSYGDEFTINIDLQKPAKTTGKLGIQEIRFQFQNKNLVGLKVKDPLLLTQKSFPLKNTSWANSDSILSFQKTRKFMLKVGRKTAAIEKESALNFVKHKVKTKFFNTWSFEAIGCSSSKSYVDQETCLRLAEKIN